MTAEDVHAPARRRIAPAELLVVLPALNEQDSVSRVVHEVRAAQPEATVLVVDDGSTDATAERAASAGALVMRLPFNLGVGGAMRAGYRYGYDLCDRHSAKMSVPNGWRLEDRRRAGLRLAG